MGDWIRAHRARLGLTRRAAVRAGAVPPAPLTPTLLADFECGDRLPTLARLPALGRALGVSPRELADWILLAPRLEEALGWTEEGADGPAALATIRAWAAAGRHEAAIAHAERAARTACGEDAQEYLLALASSLAAVESGGLASAVAQRVLDRPLGPRFAHEARLVLAETAITEGHRELARAWLGELWATDPAGARDEAVALRLELLRIELGGAARESRARRLAGLAERARRAGQVALARAAAAAAPSSREPRVPGVRPLRPLARAHSSD
jgi:transcriptional regulator with XRE-family HTH domain